MTSTQLQAIAEQSAETLKRMFAENADDILRAVQAASDEAVNNEKDSIKLNFSHAIKLNLTAKTQTDSLAFAVKTSIEEQAGLPDPDQPEFQL